MAGKKLVSILKSGYIQELYLHKQTPNFITSVNQNT